MIRWLTDLVELQGPLGRLGSIRALDLWQSRESVAQCKELVATVASLSYGNEEAKNPEKLFDRIVSLGHLSCLEFVPFIFSNWAFQALPANSLRKAWNPEHDTLPELFSGWGKDEPRIGATAFLVEAPILVVRQWFRHRAFSELEMSRRYVKGSKVPFTFYGIEKAGFFERMFYRYCLWLYDRLIAKGEKPERARRVIPVGAMTRFWVGGFDRDWLDSFCSLRCDNHAQEEIRIFANWIRDFLEAKEAK